MRILVLTRYERTAASSRCRFYQYLPFLKDQDWEVTFSPLLDDDYLQRIYSGQSIPFWRVISAYSHRLLLLSKSGKYDLIWLQYEAFPWLPYGLESILLNTKVPYVVDYDDAIFTRYKYNDVSSKLIRIIYGKKIGNIMRSAAAVIAGNEYLAEHALKSGASTVEILPTVVDIRRYLPKKEIDNLQFKIGWIGSPSTSKYLSELKPVFRELAREGNISVVTVGADKIVFDGVPCQNKSWCEETEVEDIREFDVGIMPLKNSAWERGKCGFKLIQYMACALPVVGSPVGVNKKIIRNGFNGFQASTYDEWVQKLRLLKNDRELREKMGSEGRKIVEQEYCLQITGPKLIEILDKAAREKHMRFEPG